MGQTHDESTQNLAERLGWEVARRDAARIARRLYRKPGVDAVYRRDDGALRDAGCHVLQVLDVMGWREEAHGAAIHRQLGPCVQDVLRYGGKPLCGMERIKALPSLRFGDAARRQLVGFKAPQLRQGLCPRGASTRQGERLPGPLCPATLAHNLVQWHVRHLEAVVHGRLRALATAGGVGAKGTGRADGTELETTAHDTGRGQGPRPVRREATRGRLHELEGPVSGWNGLLLLAAAPKRPLAVNVGQLQAHAARWTRAWVTQARLQLQGEARLHKGVCAKGFVDGTTRGWLDHHGLTWVVPAKPHRAVTAEARAQAAAGAGGAVGHRVHPGRPGPGKTARTERLETAVVGIRGRPTDAQEGTPAQGRQPPRRHVPPHPITAVVGRQWRGQAYGPGGKPVFLTTASVAKPRQPFDAEAERRLLENGWIKEPEHPWALGHPPPTPDRAGRVQVLFTRLLGALATAYRLACAREARGEEPVGWQRWRRQLREQTRDQVMALAPGYYGLLHLADYSLL